VKGELKLYTGKGGAREAPKARYHVILACPLSHGNYRISNLNSPISDVPTDDGLRLAFAEEKSPHQASIISYYQTVLGLPIWESGFSVTWLPRPLRGTSSISSVNYAVKVDKPSTKGHLFKGIEPGHLQSHLSFRDGNSRVRINSTRLLVYQYDPSNRQEIPMKLPTAPLLPAVEGPTLPLPRCPKPSGLACSTLSEKSSLRIPPLKLAI
jgi:hypothetical protein